MVAELDPNTRLAADRTRLAYERTLMAWVRTSTSLIAFGFTIYQVFNYLEQQPGVSPPLVKPGVVGIVMMVTALVVLALALAHHALHRHPVVAGALRGMGAVAAGLIIATGIKLIGALRTSAMGATACALLAGATFGAIAVLRWPLLWVLPVVGTVSCALTWRRIAP